MLIWGYAKSLGQTVIAAKGEIPVGPNECRLGRQGDRLVARGVLTDLVLATHVPGAGFAGMLRFSAPSGVGEEDPPLEAIRGFAEASLSLFFDSVASLGISSSAVAVYTIGCASPREEKAPQNGLASDVNLLLHSQGIRLTGSDLGGHLTRSIWLDASSGRLIVRTFSPTTPPDHPFHVACARPTPCPLAS